MNIVVGQQVALRLPQSSREIRGTVKWRGRIDAQDLAGIELEDRVPGIDGTDGRLRTWRHDTASGRVVSDERQLFACQPGYGAIVPISTISRLINSTVQYHHTTHATRNDPAAHDYHSHSHNHNHTHSHGHHAIVPRRAIGTDSDSVGSAASSPELPKSTVPHEPTKSSAAQALPFKVGDRVIMLRDSRNANSRDSRIRAGELGTAQYIGPLPSHPDGSIWVGICFDNMIGSGDGMYRYYDPASQCPAHQRFFEGPRWHCDYVPLSEVGVGPLPSDDSPARSQQQQQQSAVVESPFPINTVVIVNCHETSYQDMQGCVRYHGPKNGMPSHLKFYGIELFESLHSRMQALLQRGDPLDGSYKWSQGVSAHFRCDPGHGIYVTRDALRIAREFLESNGRRSSGHLASGSTSAFLRSQEGYEQFRTFSPSSPRHTVHTSSPLLPTAQSPRTTSAAPTRAPPLPPRKDGSEIQLQTVSEPTSAPASKMLTNTGLEEMRVRFGWNVENDSGWPRSQEPAIGSTVLFPSVFAQSEPEKIPVEDLNLSFRRLMMGTVEWIGDIEAVQGRIAGVRVACPDGNTDGSIKCGHLEFHRKRFFQCEPNHGVFVPLSSVWMLSSHASTTAALSASSYASSSPGHDRHHRHYTHSHTSSAARDDSNIDPDFFYEDERQNGMRGTIRHYVSSGISHIRSTIMGPDMHSSSRIRRLQLQDSSTPTAASRDTAAGAVGASSPSPSSSSTSSGWKCKSCTFINPNLRSRVCEICNSQRDTVPIANVHLARTTHPRYGPADPEAAAPLSAAETQQIIVAPPRQMDLDMGGNWRGIQGQNNSCSVDAVLFALFAADSSCDSYISARNDTVFADETDPRFAEIRQWLRTRIVNPLRQRFFLEFPAVMKLRTLLHETELLPSASLGSEEKDAEEVILALLKAMHVKDLFKVLRRIDARWIVDTLPNSQLYTIVLDDPRRFAFDSQPRLQTLLNMSFQMNETRLAEVPDLFIVQLPRSGDGRMFRAIVPDSRLRVEITSQVGLGGSESTSSETAVLELFAVIAIGSSHYVSFVNVGGLWIFCDSMADRLDDSENVPRVRQCGRSFLETIDGAAPRSAAGAGLSTDDELVQRLITDAYICLYRK